ncbi:MAG: histidine ammonia-lyase [Thermodesulfobacteriota bacterium]
MMHAIELGESLLTVGQVVEVARGLVPVVISEAAGRRIKEGRRLVEEWVAKGQKVYGITTGFGALADVAIPPEQAKALQRNVLLSHAAGVGEPLPEEIVRAAMLLRVQDAALGRSGLSLEVILRIVDLLNLGVVPVVPSKGSVGASGDLAPLAHMFLPLMGEGEVTYRGRRFSGVQVLEELGMVPLEPGPGEGLALINGTQVMTAIGALAAWEALQLARTADVACAMSLEVLLGTRTEFDPRIHKARPHPGQAISAQNMLRITAGSEIISSHKDCSRIQDAYTLRCSPQVHGASRDAIAYALKVVETEINSSTNNPLIFPETGEFLLGGNFHGQPVALAMDFLAIAVSELANISERRIERLVNPQLSGLPAFLIQEGGLNSGFMIAQYTAAALVSENKVLAHPASVDSIPTSANKEDHVSMGTISARKAAEVVRNSEQVLAIELLCAAQALDLFTDMRAGQGTQVAYRTIRHRIPHLDRDRFLARDIEEVLGLVRSGKLLNMIQEAVGPLG